MKKECFVSRPFESQRFVSELAFHEAAHVVFAFLMEKLNLGFVPVTGFGIFPEKMEGEMNGFNSPGKYFDSYNIKPWYLKDERRYYAKIFVTLSGFVSYKVFVEDSEFFISKISPHWLHLTNVKYHSIESPDVLSEGSTTNRIPDFDGIQERLRWKNIVERQEQIEKIRALIEDVQTIMRIPEVNRAIMYVAVRLLKNSGKTIKEIEAETIRLKVNELTKNISIEEHLLKHVTNTNQYEPDLQQSTNDDSNSWVGVVLGIIFLCIYKWLGDISILFNFIGFFPLCCGGIFFIGKGLRFW